MHLGSFALFAVLVSTVQAHATVYGAWVNGRFQNNGRNNYIRSPTNNSPIWDLNSAALACNTKNMPVPEFIKVQPGDKLTMEWTRGDPGEGPPKHKMNGTTSLPDPGNVAISASHRGPIQVYMAPYSSNGQGPVWTKIWSSAYSEGSWATDKLIKAKGLHTVYIPSIKAGKYLVRSEINALHNAATPYNNNKANGAQLYPSCMQIEVTRNGQKNLSLPGGTSFPGTYRNNSTGIVWNLYNGSDASKYKAPGPAVWSGAVGGFFGLTR